MLNKVKVVANQYQIPSIHMHPAPTNMQVQSPPCARELVMFCHVTSLWSLDSAFKPKSAVQPKFGSCAQP